MATIVEVLTAEHDSCDERFAVAEAAAQSGDINRCRAEFAQFQVEIERHFQAEETELFPAFEQRTGMTPGPTRVMRLEHQQMRDTMAEMQAALAHGELEEFLGQAETLLILMQQHNIKEEQMLYPMCDRALGQQADAVIAAMQALPGTSPAI